MIDKKHLIQLKEIVGNENIKSDNGREYDGMWSSSLTDSTSKGKPDISSAL